MPATAMRAWYWATGVSCATALTSPAAQIPGTEVRRRSSTTIPVLVVSRPSLSASSPSRFGTRPDASRIRSTRSSSSGEPSRGATVTAISSPSLAACCTKTEVAISIPSSRSAAASVAEASASEAGAIRSSASTIVTLEPKRENACPNSRPTAPAPTTSSDRGTSVSSSAEMWSSHPASSIPSIGGIAVREPVAIRIRSA